MDHREIEMDFQILKKKLSGEVITWDEDYLSKVNFIFILINSFKQIIKLNIIINLEKNESNGKFI